MAAVAVTFSFAVISCSGNKANNAAASEGEEATVACDKKADCTEKKECCDKK